MYPSQLLLESLHIQGCLYIIMYMCYVHFICLCELLLESLHIQGCLYIIMYMCVMCILSVYVCTKSAVAGVAPHLGICV